MTKNTDTTATTGLGLLHTQHVLPEGEKETPGARWRRAERWIEALQEAGVLTEREAHALWRHADALRWMERNLADDAESIAAKALRFREQLVESGATHTPPSSYGCFSDFGKHVAQMDAKVESMFHIVYALLAEAGVSALREVLGVR